MPPKPSISCFLPLRNGYAVKFQKRVVQQTPILNTDIFWGAGGLKYLKFFLSSVRWANGEAILIWFPGF